MKGTYEIELLEESFFNCEVWVDEFGDFKVHILKDNIPFRFEYFIVYPNGERVYDICTNLNHGVEYDADGIDAYIQKLLTPIAKGYNSPSPKNMIRFGNDSNLESDFYV